MNKETKMATTYYKLNKNTTPNVYPYTIGEESGKLSLTRFCGGNGEFIQLTLGREYILLNGNQIDEIIYNLMKAKHEDNLQEV
jgi:hypothetical protein